MFGILTNAFKNIVTCVPYLAPLLKGYVRDFRSNSGRKYYNSNGRSYAMETWTKDGRSQLQSHASAPKRTPSEELILSSHEPPHGGIEMTVEYRVSRDTLAIPRDS